MEEDIPGSSPKINIRGDAVLGKEGRSQREEKEEKEVNGVSMYDVGSVWEVGMRKKE